MTPEEFIQWLRPSAQKICQRYKIFTSVCMAQAALESGWGQYTIGQYNIFGRKAVAGEKSITVSTQEYIDGKWITLLDEFKDYLSLDGAVEDYCILITQDSLYENVLSYLDDLENYIKTLSAVYATDSEYTDKICSIIDNYDLIRYD